VRIGLIIRPREGMEELEPFRQHVQSLRRRGHSVRPRLTFEHGDAVRMGRTLADDGADLIIAAGGDGTLNEVLNGVMRADWAGRLAVIPTGTANDFAAGLEIPEDLEAALEVAIAGRPRDVDVARVNDRYFLNVSTGGFGATATEETPAETKRLLGPWAYVITGVRKFSELRPSRARFETPAGVEYEGEVMLFAVGNAKRTGGGSLLTPRAEFGDGELDVMIVPGMPRMDFVALLPDLRSGTHVDNPDVLYFRASRVEVDSGDELSVNADGEPIAGPHFVYGVAERPLAVMTPTQPG
jgi:diacylglycerol kinase (ATP)